ncbi:MAG: TIGR00296 family protein, partial [Nanoarchaeota archaeon]
LIDGLIDAAIQSTRDPRFKELDTSELDDIEIEISILTKPELIEVTSPEEYPQKVELGKDGLIAESGVNRGLLLPQVATEHQMNAEEFLDSVCAKADLSEDSWKKGNVRIYKFQADVFSE